MHTTRDIFFSKNHFVSPFTFTDETKKTTIQLSSIEKAATIALGILVGAVTAGIGGIFVFYLTTAVLKAKRINHPPTPISVNTFLKSALKRAKRATSSIDPEEASKPKRKKVEFDQARERKFKKTDATEAVGHAHSSQIVLFTPEVSTVSETQQTEILAREMTDDLKLGVEFGFGRSEPYPTSVHVRRVPPLSLFDTVIIQNNEARSIHGGGSEKLFKNKEILQVHSSIRTQVVDGFIVDFTAHNKVVIQQQATRGCTAGAAAMLIFDAGKEISYQLLRSTNLADTKEIVRWIENASLPVVCTLAIKADLTQLKELIQKNGSAIVSTNNNLGSHVIVVDHIRDDLQEIRLRDPFHGWEITVTKDAFLREYKGGDIIQIGK